MDYNYLFEPYDELIVKADDAFDRMTDEFPASMKCKRQCSDCCHAVFGLFLIEAIFLKRDFDKLSEEEKEGAFLRGMEADKELEKLERTLKEFADDPQMSSYSLAKARVRCPLLNDHDECILYPYRPITCRVYGIPTMIHGVPRVCGKAGFEKEQAYPTFSMDKMQEELYELSKELVKSSGVEDDQQASLLFSISKVIRTPVEQLIKEIPVAFDEPGSRES
jgi:Fe-S-cluster containining protein